MTELMPDSWKIEKDAVIRSNVIHVKALRPYNQHFTVIRVLLIIGISVGLQVSKQHQPLYDILKQQLKPTTPLLVRAGCHTVSATGTKQPTKSHWSGERLILIYTIKLLPGEPRLFPAVATVSVNFILHQIVQKLLIIMTTTEKTHHQKLLA